MLRSVSLACVAAAGPAFAGCPPPHYLSPPKIIDLPYPEARNALIKAGFQPLLDWARMQHDYHIPEEAWIAETGYFEVQACSNLDKRACRANFVDGYRNLFRVVTEIEPSGRGSKVTDALFVCGTEAAHVFGPELYE